MMLPVVPSCVSADSWTLSVRPRRKRMWRMMMSLASRLSVSPADRDAFAGGSLAGDREVGISDADFAGEIDAAGDVEHDGSRPAGGDGLAEAAGAGVVEIGDVNHLAAASAGRDGAPTFGAGKGGDGVARHGRMATQVARAPTVSASAACDDPRTDIPPRNRRGLPPQWPRYSTCAKISTFF